MIPAAARRWVEPGGIHPAAWGTVLYVLVSVGRLPEVLPLLEPLMLGKVGIALALLGMVAAPADRRQMGGLVTPIGVLLVALVLLAGFSVLFSIWRSYTLMYFFDIIAKHLLMFYLIVKTMDSRRMVRVYMASLVVSGGFLALLTVRAGRVWGGRVELQTAYDANDLAMILVAVLAVTVAGCFVLRGFRRWGLHAVAAALLLAIMMTGSRGGFLGLLAVAGYLLLARFPTAAGSVTSRLSPLKLTAIALGIGLLIALVPDYTWERMRTLTEPSADYNITDEKTGRLAIWRRGMAGVLDNPLGHGLASFEVFYAQRTGIYKAAHNTYIQIAVELGVVGLMLFLALLVLSWRTAGRIVRALHTIVRRRPLTDAECVLGASAVGLRGALIGYFVTSVFLSAAYTPLPYVLMAAVAGIAGLAERSGVLAEGRPERWSPLDATARSATRNA